MNTTNCPVCHEMIEEMWESHIPEGEGYWFPCPHCGTDLIARWNGDGVVLTRDPGPTAQELYNRNHPSLRSR